MAIKGRQTLYSIFVNGAIPTQNDYRDLIDSALNRRDDHFFGEWQKGMKYCEGDVVIYAKALYKLLKTEEETPCPPGEEVDGNEAEEGCYCSLIEPPYDTKNWCVFELDLKDKDWEIICEPEGDPEGKAIKIYQMTAKVGIGTEDPKALLDITKQNKILVNPDDAGCPDISLQKCEETEFGTKEVQQYVRYRLCGEVCWESDAPAYVFKKIIQEEGGEEEEEVNVEQQQYVKASASGGGHTPVLLMKVTSNDKEVPQVGIGADQPEGGLHVNQDLRGKVLVNPANHQEPGVLIVNLEESSNGYYSLSGVNNEYAYMSTNAAGGFRFKKDSTDSEALMKCDSAAEGLDLVAILGDGRVGIGTVDPKSYVEITDSDSGSIRLQFGNDAKKISNPALSINNFRPKTQAKRYMTFGIDDSYGIICHNAPSGLVIKKGGDHGENNNEVNVNQGKVGVYIAPDGKTGINTDKEPDVYHLDVKGHIRSLTAHLKTNTDTVTESLPLGQIKDPGTGEVVDEDIITKVCNLNPIRFTWNDDSLKAEGEQIGITATNLNETFPELVKGTGSEKAVAYGNLTAVLVKAIQDQQKMIEILEGRICDLEERHGKGD